MTDPTPLAPPASEEQRADPYPMFTPPRCCIQCDRPIKEGEECHLTSAAAVHARCLDRYTRGEDPRVRRWLEGRKVVAPPMEER